MLRGGVIGLGVLLLAGAVVAVLAGAGGPAVGMGLLGALLVAGTVFERRRYRPLADQPPGAGWERTGERFRDPGTGVAVEVWFNAATGQRRYVRAGAAIERQGDAHHTVV